MISQAQQKLIAAANVVCLGETTGGRTWIKVDEFKFGFNTGSQAVTIIEPTAEKLRVLADLLDLAALLRGEMPEPPDWWEDTSGVRDAELTDASDSYWSCSWHIDEGAPTSTCELEPSCYEWLRLKRWQLILQREGLL